MKRLEESLLTILRTPNSSYSVLLMSFTGKPMLAVMHMAAVGGEFIDLRKRKRAISSQNEILKIQRD
jgi:hypothetical protein